MLNRAEFIGNIGKDIDVRETNSGAKVAQFSLAVSSSWKDKSGERKTTWINVVLFNEHLIKLAENYLRKGSKIYIAGEIQNRQWQDKEGNTKYITELVLSKFEGTIEMLDSRDNTDSAANTPNVSQNNFDDEIPF